MLLTRLKKGGASSPTLYNKLEMEVSNMIPKFRAWDKENKKIYGCYGFDDLNERIYRCNLANSEFRKAHLETVYAVEDDLNNFELMQSTGLKDKNGVEIFEGDVVKWGDTLGWEETPIRIATVEIDPDIQFDSNVGIFSYGQFAYKNTEKFLTILGNIYENPELLEVEG